MLVGVKMCVRKEMRRGELHLFASTTTAFNSISPDDKWHEHVCQAEEDVVHRGLAGDVERGEQKVHLLCVLRAVCSMSKTTIT